MRILDDRLELSASDLANHLGCRHLTQLDLLVARRALMPPRWRDPTLDVLQQRGLELEQLYLESLGLAIMEAGGDGEVDGDRTRYLETSERLISNDTLSSSCLVSRPLTLKHKSWTVVLNARPSLGFRRQTSRIALGSGAA
jgi:hypothetical protein